MVNYFNHHNDSIICNWFIGICSIRLTVSNEGRIHKEVVMEVVGRD